MNQLIKVLSGLLALQIVITVAANIGGDSLETFSGDEKLIAINFDDVNSIQIRANAKNVIDIKRENGEWLIPELDGFPADQEKITDLISTLSNMEKGWPVATTSSASKRFKVDADDFERNIVLQKDDKKLANIYIGSSPGFRKVHARVDGVDEIHAVEFNAHDANANTDSWVNKNILRLSVDNIASVNFSDISLVRDNENLVLEALGEKEVMDEDAVRDFIKRVSDVSINKVLGVDKDKLKVNKPEFSYTITMKDGEQLSYEFSPAELDKIYVLKTSKHEFYFEIQDWKVNLIKDFKREKLVKAKEKPVEAVGKADNKS